MPSMDNRVFFRSNSVNNLTTRATQSVPARVESVLIKHARLLEDFGALLGHGARDSSAECVPRNDAPDAAILLQKGCERPQTDGVCNFLRQISSAQMFRPLP